MTRPTHLTRRDVLTAGASLGAGLLLPIPGLAALPPAVIGHCPMPTSFSTAGPFYFDPGLTRHDITEGLPGLPLQLFLRVLDRSGCGPVPGAIVEVWHAAAQGRYSGYASEGTAGQTFLRGAQAVDPRGVASFDTVYPGWYPSRTPHIHVKVSDAGGTEILTTQIYFSDAASTWVYTNSPAYISRGLNPTDNGSDGLYSPDEQVGLRQFGGIAQAGITLTV